MIWVIRNWCIFEMVTDTNMKRLENSKEARLVFVISIDMTYEQVPISCLLDPRTLLHATSTYGDMLKTGTVYQPPMPQPLREPPEGISDAIATVDESELRRTRRVLC
jgi:hypothetical protein